MFKSCAAEIDRHLGVLEAHAREQCLALRCSKTRVSLFPCCAVVIVQQGVVRYVIVSTINLGHAMCFV